jgi:hypothetical protein
MDGSLKMKKSEAVNLIVKYFEDTGAFDGIDKEELLDEASYLLGRLLKAGMQPPNRKNYASNGNLWNISPGWEDEDGNERL